MERYDCVYKGDVYNAEISDSVFGGNNLTIWKTRQGREPKVSFTNHYNSRFDALMAMEKWLPDATWNAK